MKKKKLSTTTSIIFVILITLATHSSHAVSASIPFTNINMENDDVLNYDGVRIVIFFKTTCPSCHNQIETLKELEQDYQLSLIALNVDAESTNGTLIETISDLSLSANWTLGYASSQSISLFGFTVVPSQVILDNNSEIVAVTESYFNYESMETIILDAINHRTENYSENPISDSSDLLTALFIIIGVAVTTIVVVFLFRYFKRGDKKVSMLLASKKLEIEDEESKTN